jgi:hypothetical protein
MSVSNQSDVASVPAGEARVRKLAQLFPGAIPVRIPVQVSLPRASAHLVEQTIIVYGTPTEVLFPCTLPLELDDRVHLQNSDGSLTAEATVVAVQFHDGKKAVAARFLREVSNWIIKQ